MSSKWNSKKTVVTTGITCCETYDFVWKIDNYSLVQMQPHYLLSQGFPIETDANSPYHSKWTVGLHHKSNRPNGTKLYRIGCTLEQIYGNATKFYASLSAKVDDEFDLVESKLVKQDDQIIIPYGLIYNLKNMDPKNYSRFLDSKGTLKIKIQLQILKPVTKLKSAFAKETEALVKLEEVD